MQLALFPLPNVVLPEGTLPLRLFEPRYINMVSSCLKTDSGFGVCLIREGVEAGQPAQPYPQGTVVKITDFDQGRDGLLHITATGIQEFILQDYEIQPDGLLLGQVNLIDRPTSPSINAERSPQDHELSNKLSLILDYLEPHMSFPDRKLNDMEWVSNRLLELLPIDSETKSAILQSFDLEDRLKALHELDFTVASH